MSISSEGWGVRMGLGSAEPMGMSTAMSQKCTYMPQSLPLLQRKPLDSTCSINSKQANTTFFHIRIEQRCWH